MPAQQTLSLEPVSEYVGAEVKGVDLSAPVTQDVFSEINNALANHGMLLFRDQQIQPNHHIDFSRLFGELDIHVLSQYQLPNYPEIFVISNVKEDGKAIGATGGGTTFHSDMSYMPRPSMGSLFYCVKCPPIGGGTSFVSMFSAYDELPQKQKEWITQQKGVHDYAWHYENYLTHRTPLTDEQKTQLQPSVHPAVRTHPVSGKQALYLSVGLTSHFDGISFEESRPIIEEITDFATQDKFIYTHQWRVGDLVMWDNRSTMHRAEPFDHEQHQRLMHRTTVHGDRPFHKS